MPVSIKDIAKIAGVSHSTVSRALRNSPLIRGDTSSRIQEIAKREGYSASAIARGLVTSRTEAIGVVVTSIADPFNGEVVMGIEEVANKHGFTVILANSQADPEREVAVVQNFQARRVDGILVASSRVGAVHTPLLSELQIPIVLINNQHPSEYVHSVRVDNVDGAYQAARHLIDLGHRHIAYLGDRFGLHSDFERLGGYRRALEEAGISCQEKFIIHADGRPEGAADAVRQLLCQNPRPTAIVCYNDMSALGVFREAETQKICIPDQLSITGFDDIFFAAYLRPSLTTIRQPKKELGTRAMELLLALLEKRESDGDVVMSGELVRRGSTSKPPMPSYQAILSGKNSATRSS